ncbi:MAG: hypothetical protein JW913_12375 [Chitinispirillaceae bacterium]|nr:hypothetical protein [Chitinispirillaceae bacterium]
MLLSIFLLLALTYMNCIDINQNEKKENYISKAFTRTGVSTGIIVRREER